MEFYSSSKSFLINLFDERILIQLIKCKNDDSDYNLPQCFDFRMVYQMKKLNRHIRNISVISVLISLFFILLYIFNNKQLPVWKDILTNFLWTLFFTIGLYFANAPVSDFVEKKFPGFDWKSFTKRLLTGILGSSIVTLLAGGILYFLMLLVLGNDLKDSTNWILSMKSLDSLSRLIWIATTIATIFHVIALIQHYQAHKLKEQKEKVIQISTEHESLKSQIGSHFLFNSLNVLNGLIVENPENAQEFVGELSRVYRYVLEQKDKALVSLEEEIEFSRTYMNLIQKRYEDGLEFEIASEIPTGYKIVPLSLQILLENCIKHNRISSEEPLKVQVSLEGYYLLIINNLQLKSQLHDSTGKGLRNIINRYKTFTRKEVEIHQTAEEFRVRIPLLTEKTIAMEVEQNYTKEEIKAAKKRVDDVQDFYWNLASYIIVNLFLTFLDLRDGSYDWAYWALLGWGMGVFFHYIEVFGFFNSSSWKDRMIQKELERKKKETERFN